jgi:uncharacterized membrane protein YfcA
MVVYFAGFPCEREWYLHLIGYELVILLLGAILAALAHKRIKTKNVKKVVVASVILLSLLAAAYHWYIEIPMQCRHQSILKTIF